MITNFYFIPFPNSTKWLGGSETITRFISNEGINR